MMRRVERSSVSEPSDVLLVRLWSGLADAVVISDSTGVVVLWNQAAERLFGWSASEAIGETLDLIIPTRLRDRHWAGYRKVMETGQTSYGDRLLEVPAMHRDGRTLSVAFTVTLIIDSTGRISHIAAVLRDETVRWKQRRDLLAELSELRDRQASGPER